MISTRGSKSLPGLPLKNSKHFEHFFLATKKYPKTVDNAVFCCSELATTHFELHTAQPGVDNCTTELKPNPGEWGYSHIVWVGVCRPTLY